MRGRATSSIHALVAAAALAALFNVVEDQRGCQDAALGGR
jgi:hypothetical protein